MLIERMWYDAIGYFSHNVNTADLSHANVVIQYPDVYWMDRCYFTGWNDIILFKKISAA